MGLNILVGILCIDNGSTFRRGEKKNVEQCEEGRDE